MTSVHMFEIGFNVVTTVRMCGEIYLVAGIAYIVEVNNRNAFLCFISPIKAEFVSHLFHTSAIFFLLSAKSHSAMYVTVIFHVVGVGRSVTALEIEALTFASKLVVVEALQSFVVLGNSLPRTRAFLMRHTARIRV